MEHNIAICDDSSEYVEIISALIKEVELKYNLNFNICTFNLGSNLVQAFQKNYFDIIFLDMEMPEMNGIETGLLIRKTSKKPIIFYLTSHRDYAYESYEVKAKNYLLKPATFAVIEKNIMECIKEINEEPDFLDVKDFNGVMHRIPVRQITHILRKKEDRKLHIYTLDKNEVITNQTLENIEKSLTESVFIVRASKSCIVNMENVRTIVKNAIYFSNDVVEYASRRCLPNVVSKLKLYRG